MNELNKFQFYLEGKKYKSDFIDAINGAKESICLHTYIFKLDHFGTNVFEALLQQAERGLRIDLMIDEFGSFEFDKKIIKKHEHLKNLSITFFNPISVPKILRIGRRLHHKILIVDKSLAIVGGMNIVDEVKDIPLVKPRLDFAVKIENSSVEKLYDYCQRISQIVSEKFIKRRLPDINDKINKSIFFHYNDWFYNRKQITSRYIDLINGATKSIYLIHGYFFPSFRILRKLRQQARKGVKVVLILPKYSDWTSWVRASEYLYPKLLKSGIEIREWQLSRLHGKLAIFDEEIILVGSYNLNYTSSYGNLEMNVEISKQEFVEKVMNNEMDYILKVSEKLSISALSKLSISSKLLNIISYLILLIISTISINLIKASRLVKDMTNREVLFFLILAFIGILGIFLPFLPGIPFLVAALCLLSKKRVDS